MSRHTRREFGAGALASLIALAAQRRARAGLKPAIVVVGGGVGGATAARYLAMEGFDVTLVEPKRRYVTCYFSSLYLAGLRSLDSLSHGYAALSSNHGVKVLHNTVTGIDPVSKSVTLDDGASLRYDRLVLSPGIAFKYGEIEGYDEAAAQIMPHAWNAGPQSELLRRQIEAMADGSLFVMVAPPDPFRCPPAPYERACLVAYYLKQFKPRSKILILDAKDAFKSQELFEDAWARHYPGMIEWLPAQFTGGVKAIDVKTRTVRTENDSFVAGAANIIPAQTAGQIALTSGVAGPSGWCPIDPETFESKLVPGIHVVGDAVIGGDMPKSAFSANSQAKACAFAIAEALLGGSRFRPHLFNSCYTWLAPNDAFTNALVFAPKDGTLKATHSFVDKVGESAEKRRQTAREAVGWYAAFAHDVFG